MPETNDVQFSYREWRILRYLYHRDVTEANGDDEKIIANGLGIDVTLALLLLAKLMNEGWVAKVVDSELRDRYLLSLEGFELMESRRMT